MMHQGDGKWIFGAVMALIALIGLFMASRATDATLYWTGLAFFLFGVLTIFALIARSYEPPRHHEREEAEEETSSSS